MKKSFWDHKIFNKLKSFYLKVNFNIKLEIAQKTIKKICENIFVIGKKDGNNIF